MKSSSRTILSRFTLLATIAASPLLMTDAQAFGGKPGGPFSNGTYFPTDGTFSAVLRATDLVGTLQFSTSSSSVSSGTAVVYNEGTHYYGNSSGAFNPSSKEITVQFQASSEGQGQQSFTYQETIQVDNTTTTIDPETGQSTSVTETTILDGNSTTYSYFDSSFCSGQATCKTKNDFPNQKFSGIGTTDFKNLVADGAANAPFVSPTTYKDVTVTGVRLSNTATAFASVEVRPPTVSVTSINLAN
jgi:hypothetical protein